MSERSLSTEPFDYARAFSRTIGWITTAEQPVLRAKRVAIAGLGGVGGAHLLTLTRLGIQAFNLADFDRFGTENFNRQAGAFQSTVGQPKVEVVSRMARDINPDLDINTFPDGVTPDNMEEFLSGVDLYVDGLDFFVLDIRARLFALCAERGIPAITAAPLGMGAAVLAFLPGRMTFEQYFQLEGQPRNEQLLRFMVGLAPAVLHQAYLVEADHKPEQCLPGRPLSYSGYRAWKFEPGTVFDLAHPDPGQAYSLSVVNGVIRPRLGR